MLRFLRFKPRLLSFTPVARPQPAEKLSYARSAVARWADRLLICLFAAAIALPAVWGLGFSESGVPRYENRNPAPLPALSVRHGSWKLFPVQFEHFFNDHLGFRRELVDCHAHAKLNWFELSSSAGVAIGPNGWFFLRTATPFDEAVQQRPPASEQAHKWCECLRDRQDWLAKRGVRYLVLIAPEKESIYPEEFPRNMRYLLDEPVLDEFLKQAEQMGLPVVDVRPALWNAKGQEPLYYKYDTHWNGVGGWYGAAALLGRLQQWRPEFTVPRRSDYSVTSTPYLISDLAGTLSLTEIQDTWYYLKSATPSTARPIHVDFGTESSLLLCPNEPSGFATDHRDRPRALLLHDSFGLYLLEHLTEQFREVDCFWSYKFPKEFIERYQPDLVIQEIVERNLKLSPTRLLLPHDSP